jgi:RND family efflux transporter MFP subunit
LRQLHALLPGEKAPPSTSASHRFDWRKSPVLLVIVLIAAAALLFSGWIGGRLPQVTANDRAPSGAAHAAATGLGDAPGIVASGYVIARRQATVAAEVTAKVVDVLVDEGELVRAGQILAILDDRTIRAQQSSAESRARATSASIGGLQSDLVEARAVLGRSEALRARGFASAADLTAKEARVASLESQIEQARASADAARFEAAQFRYDAGRYRILAPFTGVLVEKTARPGEIISPITAGGSFTRTGIGTLVDMGSLEIEVDVNEAYIGRIRLGQRATATLSAYPGSPRGARVIAVIPTVSREKATVRVRLAFDTLDQQILPNMGVKVQIDDRSGR